MDLINTVRQRYGRAVILRRDFTLVHRNWPAAAAPQEKPRKKGGLLDFFRPQLSSVSKKIHEEIAAILTRQAEAREKTFRTELGREVLRQASVWKEFAARTEKNQREQARATDKRFDLVLVETNKRLAALRRDTDLLAKREATKKREMEATPREELPLSAKNTRRMIEGRLEEANGQLETEIKRSARKSVHDTVRRLREEEEYDRMRNAGRVRRI